MVVLIGCERVRQTEIKDEQEGQMTETIAIERPNDMANLPEWLTQLYPTEIRLEYQTISQGLTVYYRVNDSISYCIYDQMDGVCTRHFLQTFVHNTKKDHLEIGNNCDHDQSRPEYTWKEFEMKSPTNILTVEYKESVHDSLITTDGWLKEKYTFSDLKTVVDTTSGLAPYYSDNVVWSG